MYWIPSVYWLSEASNVERGEAPLEAPPGAKQNAVWLNFPSQSGLLVQGVVEVIDPNKEDGNPPPQKMHGTCGDDVTILTSYLFAQAFVKTLTL